MNLHIKLLSICAVLLLAGCNARVSTQITKTYPELDIKQEIKVVMANDVIPENTEVIGMVEVGDNGLTGNSKCTYEAVIEKAKEEARKAGGNAIKITKHKTPDVISSCHRITADILRIENADSYLFGMKPGQTADSNYATLNIFRDDATFGVIFDLFIGKSLLCRVPHDFKKTILIKADGPTTLWTETEKKEELEVDLRPGHVYYLRCGVSTGIAMGRPSLSITESDALRANFETFTAKKTEPQDTIILQKEGTAIRYKATAQTNADSSILAKDTIVGERLSTYDEIKDKRFVLSLEGGYSRRTAGIAKETPLPLKEHLRNAKNGYNIGGDLSIFFSKNMGAGLKFSMFKASDECEYLPRQRVQDDYSIPIFGPMLAIRYPFENKKHCCLTNFSFGYMGYENNGELDAQKYHIKGRTVFAALDFGYDYWFASNWGVGFKLSIISGTLSKYTLDDEIQKQEIKLDKDHKEGIGRLNLSVGIRFGK